MKKIELIRIDNCADLILMIQNLVSDKVTSTCVKLLSKINLIAHLETDDGQALL